MAQQYFSRRTLSGASNGSGVLMPNYANTSAGTAGSIRIHTPNGSEFDEIWLYATNVGTAVAVLTLWWASPVSGGIGAGASTGGFGGGGSQIQYTVSPGSGLILVVPGLILGPGLYLNGSANVATSIVVYGFVNHIGPTM